MRREDITYVRTKRSRIIHAVDPTNPRYLLCGWGNNDLREPCEYDPVRLCSECNAKIRRRLCHYYETPTLRTSDRQRFYELSKPILTGIRLEAAQKGYWGIL